MEEAIELLRDTSTERSWAHYQLGWIDLADGDAPGATAHFEAALATVGPYADEVQNVHSWCSLALAKAAVGDAPESFRLARGAVDAARQLGIPGLVTMTLVRAAQVEALADSAGWAELAEALRRLRDLHKVQWWVSDALALAGLASEARGRADVAARLLGAAQHLATEASAAGINRGTWSALPMLCQLVEGARLRLGESLGTEGLIAHEAAGSMIPVKGLIEMALTDLAAEG